MQCLDILPFGIRAEDDAVCRTDQVFIMIPWIVMEDHAVFFRGYFIQGDNVAKVLAVSAVFFAISENMITD